MTFARKHKAATRNRKKLQDRASDTLARLFHQCIRRDTFGEGSLLNCSHLRRCDN
jgi:hypothetical protein